jgi:sugar lactone lactonase YvrE
MRFHFRFLFMLASALVIALAGCGSGDSSTAAGPDLISLPDGFRPEGVAITGNALFVGSIPTGRVLRADITTGQSRIVVDPPAGRSAIGLKVDEQSRLFVAGGATGEAYVYDANSGAELARYTLAEGEAFINDVIVTPQAAWFTDSRNPVLYRLPFGADGALPAPAEVTALALGGEFLFEAGVNNANGIDATPDGETLIIVQSNAGLLFTVDPVTGAATAIGLGGDSVPNGDGILLQGQTLFVVQNRLNMVAVITLSQDFATGTVEQRLTDPAFDVPTTVAASDGHLFLPNARFGIPDPDTASYSVVRIAKP